MNYTQNYHLPQWVEADRIRMEDFNQMCANIENGISAAQNAADAAQATANTALDTPPYVLGSYKGTAFEQEITLGFRPTLVIIFSDQYSGGSAPGGRIFVASATMTSNRIAFTDTGFKVLDQSTGSPLVNYVGNQFQFIAFK